MKSPLFRWNLPSSSLKGWLAPLLSGTAVTVLAAVYRAFSLYQEREGALWSSLCDGAFIAAVLLVCTGLLLWIGSTGQFDGLTYVAYSLRRQLFPLGGLAEERPDFYHYKLAKEQKRRDVSPLPLLGSGGIFLLLAGLFLLIGSC